MLHVTTRDMCGGGELGQFARISWVKCAKNATLGGARTVMGRSERLLAHVKNSSIKIQEFNCLVQTGFRSCWMMTCVFCTSPLLTYRLTTESSPDLCESLTIPSATMGLREGTDNSPVHLAPPVTPIGALIDV